MSERVRVRKRESEREKKRKREKTFIQNYKNRLSEKNE